MKGVTIKRKTGARVFSNNEQAERVGNELLALEEKVGQLNPEMVVRHALDNPGSNLHSFFEWNDTLAARQWRIEQAKMLLRSVVIVREEDPRGTEIRLFVNIDRVEDEPSKYVNTQRAMADDEMRAMVLSRVEHELYAIRRKHTDLHELAGVWKSIDQLQPAV